MEKRPVYLPIEVEDVFKLISEGKTKLLYFTNANGSLIPVDGQMFFLGGLNKKSFYVKQDYVPKNEQDVPV